MQIRPRLLIQFEVLMMTVSELSTALRQMATTVPQLTFEPHFPGTMVSDDFDVAVSSSPETVCVAEPTCGRPLLADLPPDLSEDLQTCHSFINSLEPPRSLLLTLTQASLTELPDFPSVESHVGIFRLAELCNVHVTTVGRAIHGKVCQTPHGLVPFSQFITNLRK